MEVEYLLRELEDLAYRVHVPGFAALIDTVRSISEKTTEVIPPAEPISDAARTLTALHTQLDSLCLQFEASLPAFQATYTGAGSDAYHTTASFALQGMQQQRDALAHAAQLHQTMAEQLALARQMQLALIAMLAIVVVTLTALVASAGADAPVTVPAAIAETAGAVGLITTFTEALEAASIAVNALLAFLTTDEGLGLLTATAIALTELTHPQVLAHPMTTVPTTSTTTTPGMPQKGPTIYEARAHQDQLPTGGDRSYIPPKKGRGQPIWDAESGGFLDAYGNVWVWAKAKHGGDHWDVQHPDGSHTNVASNGTVIGRDRFSNKRK